MSKGKWKWYVGFVDGFGELAFQVDPEAWNARASKPRVTARRLTRIVAGPQGVQLVRWFLCAPLGDGKPLISGDTVELDASKVSIVATPSKKITEGLLSIWTKIVTATEAPPVPGRGNNRLLR